jgi:hypothetical protein
MIGAAWLTRAVDVHHVWRRAHASQPDRVEPGGHDRISVSSNKVVRVQALLNPSATIT